jgi:hypothetical protein
MMLVTIAFHRESDEVLPETACFDYPAVRSAEEVIQAVAGNGIV